MAYILYVFLKAISYIPFFIWHGIADLIWLLNFYVIGYRKKVVMDNLAIAFPEKTISERKKIALKFYRNFSDFIIESIKAFSMTNKDFQKRYQLSNVDDLIAFAGKDRRGIIITASHHFNWEWMISAGIYLPKDYQALIAFTPISNKSLNKLMTANRERFGLKLFASNKFTENVQEYAKNYITISGLVADQSPKSDYKFRTGFFGVNVPVFTGPETLAKRLNQSLWFLHTEKVGRSKYVSRFELISNQVDTMEEGKATEIYIQKVEELIKQFPENYLWTHRRWKHRKD